MAMLDEQFDVTTMPVSERNFEPLPEGWYSSHITQAELKPTKDGTGKYIKCRYDITGPTHQGRVVFGNINIRNKNPEAERIAREQLGELMRAIGLVKVNDTDQLIGAECSIKLVIRPADGQYDAGNDIKGYRAPTGRSALPAPTAPAAAAPTPVAPAAEPGKAAPPWMVKK
jgi:hypothetical protein